MRLIKKLIISIVLLSGIACLSIHALLYLKQKQENTTSKLQVTVGYLPISAAIPLFIAKDLGIFDELDVDVALVKYQNGAIMAEDVISGRIDAASPGPVDVYLDKETTDETAGRFLIYLQTAYTPDNYIYSMLVRKNSGITNLSQLKGKKIGVFPGVTNSLLCSLALNKMFGWKIDKDFFINGISPALQLDALQVGEYDAICPLEPIGTIGASRDSLLMIDKGQVEREVLNPLYITAHSISTIALERNAEGIKRFVLAMEKAVDYLRQNETQARTLLENYTSLNSILSQKTPLGNVYKTSEADRGKFQELADLLYKQGVLKKKIDIKHLYYTQK